jgi:hypothetical protein
MISRRRICRLISATRFLCRMRQRLRVPRVRELHGILYHERASRRIDEGSPVQEYDVQTVFGEEQERQTQQCRMTAETIQSQSCRASLVLAQQYDRVNRERASRRNPRSHQP